MGSYSPIVTTLLLRKVRAIGAGGRRQCQQSTCDQGRQHFVGKGL